MNMRAASCFSGIMAAELAMPQYDWVWHAEIERFPSAVAAERFPESLNLGDVLAHDFIDRARALGPLDLMAGGPPCQAFSIAGLRGSLDDARGNLTLRWVQILHAIRPRNAITENVPGWLSTDDNAFGCFLGAIVGAGYPLVPGSRTPPPRKSSDLWRWQPHKRWRDRGRRKYRKGRHIPIWPSSGMVAGPRARAAWRILDAQYFGVAQRRERVFVVIDFGDGADPAEVLFERKSVRGNHPPSRQKGKAVAALTSTGVGVGGPDDNQAQAGHLIHAIQAGATRENPASGPDGVGVQADIAYTLEARPEVQAVSHTLRGEGFDATEDGSGRGTPLIPVLAQYEPEAFGGNNTSGAIDVATALTAHGGPKGRIDFASETFVVEEVAPVMASGCEGSNGAGIGRAGDPAFALDTQGQQGVVAYRSTGNAGTYETGDVVGALTNNRDPNGQFVVAPVDLRNAIRDPDKTGDDQRQGTGIGEVGDPSGSLTTGPVPGVICFGAKGSGQDVSYDLAPTMRAMNEVSGNANGGGQPAVAVALRGTAVRKIMPIECHRLQGFPEVRKTAILPICFDRPASHAPAACQNPKSPECVADAESNGSPPADAPSAVVDSIILYLDRDDHVAVYARTSCEPEEAPQPNPGKSKSNVRTAALDGSFLRLAPPAGIAQLAATMMLELERLKMFGCREIVSTVHGYGGSSGWSFGSVIPVHVGGVQESTTVTERLTVSTTSPLGPDIQSGDSILRTSSSFVAAAIIGCIPSGIELASSFTIRVSIDRPWCQITFRGKPAADGPIYKVLGNSWAVPVGAWLGRRLHAAQARLVG